MHQGRFSRTRRSHDRNEFSGIDLQINAMQYGCLHLFIEVGLMQAGDRDQERWHTPRNKQTKKLFFNKNDNDIPFGNTFDFHLPLRSFHPHHHPLFQNFTALKNTNSRLPLGILNDGATRHGDNIFALTGDNFSIARHADAQLFTGKGEVEFYAILRHAVAVGSSFVNLTDTEKIEDPWKRIEFDGTRLAYNDKRDIHFGNIELDAIGRGAEHGNGGARWKMFPILDI